MTSNRQLKRYLKPSVVIEPLINNWYGWTHLISPVTAAALFKKRYFKIMNSFINHPELHQKAFQDKRLTAGPYVNYPKERAAELSELHDTTVAKLGAMLELIDDVHTLNQNLLQHQKGYSLETLYRKIPVNLKGLVELTYDLNHQPNFRLFESLVYKKFYNTDSQAIYLSNNLSRNYILSTPRLADAHSTILNIPFNSTVTNRLMAAKLQPVSMAVLADAVDLNESDWQKINILFEENSSLANSYQSYMGAAVRVRYFGHACVLLETANLRILIDPQINTIANETAINYDLADLPDKIDFVLLTHNHQDHISLETLLQIKHKISCIVVPANNDGFLADPSIKLALTAIGFENIMEIKTFDEIKLGNDAIILFPFLGEHGDLDIRSKGAFYVRLNNKTFLFAADSNNLDNHVYLNLQAIYGKVDYLFIGMECVGAPYSWNYDHVLLNKPARDLDHSRRLNGSNAAKIIHIIEALTPAHVVIYAMGMEPWLSYLMGLSYHEGSEQIIESNLVLQYCATNNIKAVRPLHKHEWVM